MIRSVLEGGKNLAEHLSGVAAALVVLDRIDDDETGW